MKCCCFTGNRPARFPWGYDENDNRCKQLKDTISAEIERLIEQGYDKFIAGMALGADIFCAEAVLKLKEKYPFVSLECALPCGQQTKGWSQAMAKRHEYIVGNADKVTTVSEHYTRFCMMKRNAYMVDNADFVLAVWDGVPSGGTYNTIEKARRDGKGVKIVGYKN